MKDKYTIEEARKDTVEICMIEITALKQKQSKLVTLCNTLIKEIAHYEDCDSESSEDETNCDCGARFERNKYRVELEKIGVSTDESYIF